MDGRKGEGKRKEGRNEVESETGVNDGGRENKRRCIGIRWWWWGWG